MRNRYLDLLRAAAIVRVIVYHLYGWPWLSVVLPAMGIMFTLAGSLTAASLGKRPAEQVVAARLRRVLPPLWLLGVIAVPVMLVVGWTLETDGDHPFRLSRLALWILPVGDPPGSQQGIDAWEPLWYIRAYVWFALLSPALFALYRRIGWAAVALPLALTLLVVGSGALVGAMLFLGAFDPRVHDTDDVARLGFPVLGHVPGFPGDQVGSLRSRGARRARVPWYLRWRSRR